jgi:tRNA nucleotidyltransferase/poly(A) polymerase
VKPVNLNLKLNSKVFQAGLKVAGLLNASHFQAFWVGGAVRNQMLKLPSDNIDIATDATPDEVEKILNQNKIKTKPVGKQFGSILAVVNHFPIEITTFRAEGRYSDNRHPDQVRFIKKYQDDAKRRDFTINALYFDPIKKELFDPTNGIKDLKLKLLRFVGDPKKRIDEDALRMLRGARLATQLNFKLEKNSFAAIKTRAKYIQGVSGERVKAELDKILLTNPSAGIELLDKTGLLKFLIPEMEAVKTFSHKSKMYHLEGSMFNHTLLALSKTKKESLDLLYALLFHDLGKPQQAQKVLKDEGWVISTKGHADVSADMFLQFTKKLKFPNRSKRTIEWLIRNHMLMVSFFKLPVDNQLEFVGNPDFPMLLKHWTYDEQGTKRIGQSDGHHKLYLKSLRAAKELITRIHRKQSLISKLSRGNLVLKYNPSLSGATIGKKLLEIKKEIIFDRIKKASDVKVFLEKSLDKFS